MDEQPRCVSVLDRFRLSNPVKNSRPVVPVRGILSAGRRGDKDDDLIDKSLVEHATLKKLTAEIEAMEVGDEFYDAKIRVLGEMVKQHIKEEEEELFLELQSTKMDLDAVGKKLAERKRDLMAEMQA